VACTADLIPPDQIRSSPRGRITSNKRSWEEEEPAGVPCNHGNRASICSFGKSFVQPPVEVKGVGANGGQVAGSSLAHQWQRVGHVLG
jgi:hypothetical protein